jgi:hypothetical protein
MAEGGYNIHSRNNYPDRMQQSQQGFIFLKTNIFRFTKKKTFFFRRVSR